MKAKDVKHIAHCRLVALTERLGNKIAAVNMVTENNGPSESWTRKFLNEEITNPTVDRLDELIAALDLIDKAEKAAA